MFEGFEQRTIETDDTAIDLVVAGDGPPVLLLHGYPQTRAMWHSVAPRLAERYRVVVPDLRGYGNSAKPPGGPDHAGYSKRAMAADQVAVMTALGADRFAVLGHDRGARAGHRMALDHRDRVERLAVLDIVPTLTVFSQLNQGVATGYYHWFFLIQDEPLPERLIGNDPAFYLHWCLARLGGDLEMFHPDALAEYERCFTAETIHASCEDYRAAASIDLEHDRADLDRPLACPVLALWGARGRVHQWYDVLACWREHAERVSGGAIDAGHFLVEERAAEVGDALLDFLRAS